MAGSRNGRTVRKAEIGKESVMTEKAKVYFIKDITPENIVKIYDALKIELPGKVAVKLHSGE